MKRLPGWELLFDDFITARMRAPFVWGSNDCAMFAADCVRTITGRDLTEDFRGYKTPASALRLVERYGGLAAIATRALGAACDPDAAVQGDVVLVQNAGRELLAICNGVTAFAPTDRGLAALDMSAARAAWSV